jgi:tetratricopeptide (TPR) repeat protein
VTKLGDALVLRGAVKRSLRDYSGAADDLMRALEVDRANAEAAYQLAVVRAKQEDWNGVLVAAEMIVSGESLGRGRLLVMKARALLVLDRQFEVQAVLTAALEAARGTVHEMEVRVNGADVAIAAGLLPLAKGMLAGVTDSGQQWLVHLWQARIAVKEGLPVVANEEFTSAMTVAPPEDKRFVSGEFAMYLARNRESLRAIALFQAVSVEEEGVDPDWVRSYMRALYDADELTRLDAFLRLLRTRGPLQPWALEMDWRIGRRQGDVAREVKALEGLGNFDTHSTDVLIYLADGYEKQGRRQESQVLVNRASAQRESLTAIQLVQLAGITARLGHSAEAARFAFDALRRDPSDPAIHMAFLNSMLRPEHDALTFDTDVVATDTAVRLRGTKKFSDQEYTYVILDRADVDARRDEFRPTDPAVSDLIGHRVGDEIVRRKGTPSEEVLIVKEINHVFVHVVREVMNNFPRRFPESTALQQFRIGESPTLEDFAPIIQSTTAHAEQAERAIKLHMEQCLPLSSVAGALGKQEGSLLEHLTRSTSLVLNVERGGPTQLEASLRAARPDMEVEGSGAVVLTRSGLFTSQEMELLAVLKQMRPRLVVPASLIDEIKGEIAELARGRESGLKHMVATGGGIQMIETPAQQVRDSIASREQLLTWLASNTEAMPRPVASLKADRDKFRELLGESAFDALALAAELEGVVYADDVGLRELGTNDWGVGGFSTFSLATVAEELGVIDSAKRDDVIVGLIERNHYFIPLRAEFLDHVLARNGYEINAQVLRVLDLLADKNLIVEFGVNVVADLLRQLSTSVAGPSALRPVTAAALEALTRGRDAMRVARQVEAAVRERMVLLPQRLSEILLAMRAFLQTRLG